MKPAYQTVIFDIDGTLLKSDRGVMNALKYTTEKMGVPYPSAEIRQKFIGPPLHYNFHDLMGMNEADTARAIDLFNEYYLPIGVFESELYPGIMELVTGLFDQGARVCIATAKSKPMADRVVAHFGLTPYLACMETKADEQPTGDKKVLIRQILEDTGAKPEECLMVGNDATEDMAAREVGMDVFLLTDCLINAKNRDLNAYPRGDFAALNAYIDALQ